MKKQYKILTVISVLLLMMSFWSKAMEKEKKIPEILRSSEIGFNDVQKSIAYVHEPFLGNYGQDPIHEGNTPVGTIKFEGSKVFVNFRGSLGTEFLPLVTQAKPVFAEEIGISGTVHQGVLNSALAFKPFIINKLTEYCGTSGRSMNELQVYLGGYSRGSAVATLLALPLRLETEIQSIQCITYATLNVFDKTGAMDYNNIIGEKNFLGFITEEDLSRSFLPFFPVGTNIIFSAARQSDSYNTRVGKGVYTHLQPLAALGLPFLGISIDKWEAHMPETYLEAIPKLYKTHK